MQKYFYMAVSYSYGADSEVRRRISAHMIRAESIEQAEKIVITHGISNPFNSKHVVKRRFIILDPDNIHDANLINRKRKGFGGSIYYEDKNGNLCKEIQK